MVEEGQSQSGGLILLSAQAEQTLFPEAQAQALHFMLVQR